MVNFDIKYVYFKSKSVITGNRTNAQEPRDANKVKKKKEIGCQIRR